MGNTFSIQSEYCKQLLENFPKAPILTLAKKAYKDSPMLFRNVENARSYLRTLTGTNGNSGRKSLTDKTCIREIENNYNPFVIPDPEKEDYDQFIFPPECNNILHIQDVHIPYHSIESLTLAIKYGKEQKVNTLLLGYDFLDFYQMSRFEKDPRKKNTKYELTIANQLLDVFQKEFPNARFFWRNGNHDERLQRYLVVKAPELLDIQEYHLKNLLHLEERGITYIESKRIVKAGKLNIIHGDEFIGGSSGGVNPARGLFLKTGENTLCGHFHKTSEHTERTIGDSVVGCWSMGCCTQLHPEYARLNKWNNGFAHIIVYKDGNFQLNNKKVIKGQTV